MSDEAINERLVVSGNPLGPASPPRPGPVRTDRYGVTQGVVFRRRYEEPIPVTGDWLDIKSAPPLLGLPCVGVERSYEQSGGRAEYAYSYEGIIAGFASEDNVTFELDFSMAEEDIRTHPQFATLQEKYGWSGRDIDGQFNKFLPEGKTAGGIGGPDAVTGKTKSRMFGVSSWFIPGCIFRKTACLSEVPVGALSGIGLRSTPPNVPGFAIPNLGNRQWIKMAPKLRRRGNSVEITEEWLLSGPNGINPDIYNAKSMQGATGGSGGDGVDGLNTQSGSSRGADGGSGPSGSFIGLGG